MRLEYLHLEKFGIFDGFRFDLSDENVRLHIVYGPNEAGKSTTLVAIGDLLFGMAERTPFNFIHPYGDLRIGAKLTNSVGQRLEFKRRKARADDLLKPDESGVLPGDALAPFLGPLDRESFERMFGLNHKRLQDGGKAMLEARGELSQSLFEAGSGGPGLGKIVQELIAEADAIGSPAKKTASKPYWRAHEQYERAQDKVRTETLKADAWTAALKQQADATALRDELDRQLSQSRARQSALERVRRVAPILRRIVNIVSEREALGEGVDLPDGFNEIWQQAANALAKATDNAVRDKAYLQSRKDELASLGDPGPWPAMAQRTEKLMMELGDYRSKVNGLANRVRDVGSLTAQLAELVRQLGSSDDPESVVASMPSGPAVARVRSLVSEWTRLDEALKTGRDELRKAERKVQNLEAAGREINEPSNPIDAKAALETAINLGDTSNRLTRLGQDRAVAERDLSRAMAALGRCTITPEQLTKIPLPTAETIAQFEARLADLVGKQEKLETGIRDQRADSRRLGAELEALKAGGEVPTSDAMVSARGRRDRGWHLIRRKYIDGIPVADETIAEFAPHGDIAGAFEDNVIAADILADRREREAARIERFSTLTGQLSKTSLDIAADEVDLEKVRKRLGDASEQWDRLWDGTGVDHGTPTDMRGWITRKDAVLTQHKALEMIEQAFRLAESEERLVRSGLFEAAGLLGIAVAVDMETPKLRAIVKTKVEAVEVDWAAAQENRRAVIAANT